MCLLSGNTGGKTTAAHSSGGLFTLFVFEESHRLFRREEALHADLSWQPVLEQPGLKSMQQKVRAIPIIAGPGLFFVRCNKAQTLILLRKHVNEEGVKALLVRIHRLFNLLVGELVLTRLRFKIFHSEEPLVQSSNLIFNLRMAQVLTGDGDGGGVRTSALLIRRSHMFYSCPPSSHMIPFKPAGTP